MTKDKFDLPDMGDLMNQLNKAMGDAEDALEDLDADGVTSKADNPLGGLGDLMGSLSSLMEGLPGGMGNLTSAIDSFTRQSPDGAGTMIGSPDWRLCADVRVGSKLHVIVEAVFDLNIISSAWQSTQGRGFDPLVGGMLQGITGNMGKDVMGRVMDQLKKGRAFAMVQAVQIVHCGIPGAPADAESSLQLSPEANIPLVMDAAGLGFDFAPLLTIKNQWDNADLPAFEPMGEQVVVSIEAFEVDDAFARSFTIEQDDIITIRLDFEPM